MTRMQRSPATRRCPIWGSPGSFDVGDDVGNR